MMSKKKLFIQIPCLNEERTLPSVIADLPRKIEEIDEIYTLIIDDGSTDLTVEVAKNIGIDYIIMNHHNIGLAKSFSRGLEACLFLGADIIINTDGDHQYKGNDISKLVKPILEKKADVVIGCRNITGHKEFSWLKKILQKIGTKVVRIISRTYVPDSTSGFRALNRASALMFSFISDFSYTLEMLIQAGQTGLNVKWIPIKTNPKLRESRLSKSIPYFILKQLKTILTIYLFYRPMHFFGRLALTSLVLSFLLALRIIYFLWFLDPELATFKIGSGILLLFTSNVCIFSFIAGLLGSVLSGLRSLSIDTRARIRNYELQQNLPPLDFDIITAPEFFKWTKMKSKKNN